MPDERMDGGRGDETMDDKRNQAQGSEPRRTLLFKDGRIYFSRETERKLLFGMTVAMLALFILSQCGWL